MSASVVASNAPEEMLPLIMKNDADCSDLLYPGVDMSSDGSYHDVFGGLPHNMAAQHFAEFTEASGMQRVTLPASFVSGSPSPSLPTDAAILILKTIVTTRDIASICACIHKFLLQLVAEKQRPSDGELFGPLTWNIARLGEMLSALDVLVCDKVADVIEAEGWDLIATISVIRAWGKVMTIFSFACIRCLVSQWVAALESATTKCKSCTPSWEAALTPNGWNHSLASRLLKGHLEPTIGAYNAVHNLLARMNLAA